MARFTVITALPTLAGLYVVLVGLGGVKAQLNLYLAKSDVNTCLKLNYDMNLYMIANNEPAALLKNYKAFYDFLSPISSSVDAIKLSWSSSPEKTKYHLRMWSSDTTVMPHPATSVEEEGFVTHSVSVFDVSFGCTGRKEGLVDVFLELNYTSVVSGSIKEKTQKTFRLKVRRQCDKTVPDPSRDPSSSDWSRPAIVGLCAGVTVIFCLTVGLGLLIRYTLKQRRLKMEFEDDLEFTEKRQYGLKKVRSLPVTTLASPKTPPVIYSPRLRIGRPRPRSDTSRSDTSIVGLICQDESDDDDHVMIKQIQQFKNKEHQIIPGRACNNTEILEELSKAWSNQLDGFVFSKESLQIQEMIGEGMLYNVHRGLLTMTEFSEGPALEVAVKILKDDLTNDLETVKCFVQEAIAMKDLPHPNVVSLIGVVLRPSLPPYIIVPYMKYGKLRKLLQQSRGSTTKTQAFTSFQLLDVAIQIARAMEYLASRRAIHLSSQNCMVGEGFEVKVDSHTPQCYPSDEEIKEHMGWNAPEWLRDGIYTEKSQVWSFGTVLWEVVTQGERPHSDLSCQNMEKHLLAQCRLPQPKDCPDELYSVMMKCWSTDPAERPTFTWLVDWLSTYQQKLPSEALKFETAEDTQSQC